MASLLIFHLLGLYPVPASHQFLVGSPFLSSYTLHNDICGTQTHIVVLGFDKNTLVRTPSANSALYVQSISINGILQKSICWLDFQDLIGGGKIEISVGVEPVRSCGEGTNALPDSLSTGGFTSL
jgi:putative alpha-1,2-mannosidase